MTLLMTEVCSLWDNVLSGKLRNTCREVSVRYVVYVCMCLRVCGSAVVTILLQNENEKKEKKGKNKNNPR